MTETQKIDKKSDENPPKSARKVPFFILWPEMRFQNLNSGQRVKNGTFWALFGGFSSLFSSFVCFYVNLMHARFQFCKKNQSNSFIFDAGALFQKFLTL